MNAEGEGTPQQIASVVEFVREHNVPAVFCESTVNDSAQRQVARETGAVLGEPLYVDSLSDANGPVPTYLDLLRHDAEAIVAGLTGQGGRS
jgi:manganese transport system substrate-binding protein